jgi:hypothetical protein
MKVLVTQPNYIPWKGYFDLIAKADKFVILDDVQYTSRDWRNRNLIKTPQGTIWLNIPILKKNKILIKDVLIQDFSWVNDHLNKIERNYKKSTYFNKIFSNLEEIYQGFTSNKLIDINIEIINFICKYLNIETEISVSSDIKDKNSEKSLRILDICTENNCTVYISSSKAKNYIDESLFKENKIKLAFEDFQNYPKYEQLWGSFEEKVSIVDLLFNEGPNTYKFMKYLTPNG